jgi:hypothetical protein
VLERALGQRAELYSVPVAGSEAHVTSGCWLKAAEQLGYEPRMGIAAGIERQLAAAGAARLAA